MELFIATIPSEFISLLAPLTLIVIGHLVEKKFIGRITAFTNSIALNVFLYGLDEISFILSLYGNVGLILGFIGLISYSLMSSMPKIYYTILISLSSFVVGSVILICSSI